MAFSGNIPKIKNPVRIYLQDFSMFIGGERGIRTPGGVTLNGFQDRRNRPLCHLSLHPSQLRLRTVPALLRVQS